MITTVQPEARKDSDKELFNKSLPLELRDAKLKLAQSLQSSLELNETINQFKSCVSEIVPFSSLNYLNRPKQVDIQLGADKVHTAHYNLIAKNYNLGEISFTRSKRFSEQELAALESFIGLLFFPLRNALLYREALNNSLKEPLTQVGNRAALELALTREFNLRKRQSKPLSILMIDVDHFKAINDTIGHQQGDKYLMHIASILKETVREVDQVFRYGGDEFVIILSDTGINQAGLIAERLKNNIGSNPFSHKNEEIEITASIGVACHRAGDTRETLFERADEALYIGKRNGRNSVVTEEEELKTIGNLRQI